MSVPLALLSRFIPQPLSQGPWKAKDINDSNRCWGPTVWDSRVSKNCHKNVWGWDSFQFRTMKQARGVRDVLNFLDKDYTNPEAILRMTAAIKRFFAANNADELHHSKVELAETYEQVTGERPDPRDW